MQRQILHQERLGQDGEHLVLNERQMAGQRHQIDGWAIQILDPAEETLPYEGRTEFTASEGRDRVIAGRAETLRERYHERLTAHRNALAAEARRLNWSFIVHHTDRPAEEVVLAIHNRLAGLERDYRFRPSTPVAVGAANQGSRA